MLKTLISFIKYLFNLLTFSESKPVTPQPEPPKPPAPPTPPPLPPKPPIPDNYSQMLKLFNELRESKNLPKLNFNEELSNGAKEHSEFMSKKKRLSHRNFNERADKLKCKYENVGHGDVNSVFSDWKNTARYRKNIVSDATEVGFAEENEWWTVIFR